MITKKNKAFTLVELIVVITILAILGTIAFINLQGYSTNARDSKRISDVNNLMKKIGIEVARGVSLSNLINPVKTNSGLIIDSLSGSSIQGVANFQTLKENGANFKDPITNDDYVLSFSVGGSGTGAYKFTQIGTLNENKSEAVVKGNYYKVKTNDSPSIMKNSVDLFVVDMGVQLPYEITGGISNNVAVNSCDTQPSYTNASFTEGTPTSENQVWQNTSNANPCYYECINGYTGSDCSTAPNSCDTQPSYTNASFTIGTPTTQNQVWQNTNNADPCYYTCINGYTGSDCSTAPNPFASCVGQNSPAPFSATTTYSGCNTPDIVVCSGAGTGYAVSACNVGATIASTDWTISRGLYFQWGRNKGFIYGDNTQESSIIPGGEGLDASNDEYGFVWSGTLPSPYSWANTDITNNWGHSTGTNLARQGPCASGYHVPSNAEWVGLRTSAGWGNSTTTMMNTLKLPKSGYRYYGHGGFNFGDVSGSYWASTQYPGNGGYIYYFDSTGINPSDASWPANGNPVRCFKN
ncbi:MAG: prepilin-type N-terminal cleavage/methylation domain-containing protein [Candidatus Gracilibacteria bacterium]|nr:prepilin-type N-terminal cleavage/methylation domain-containing protein [Candidatus Gracilibacteria bacterium]